MIDNEYQTIILQRKAYADALFEVNGGPREHAEKLAELKYPFPKRLRKYYGYTLECRDKVYYLSDGIKLIILTNDEIDAIIHLYGNEYEQFEEPTTINTLSILAHIPEANSDRREFSQRRAGEVLRDKLHLDYEDTKIDNPIKLVFPKGWYYLYTSSFGLGLFCPSLKRMTEREFRFKYHVEGLGSRMVDDIIAQTRPGGPLNQSPDA